MSPISTAPPPAAPPPPPPPSDSDANSTRSLSTLEEFNKENKKNPTTTATISSSSPSYNSYQKSNSRFVNPPIITNYGLSPQQQFYGTNSESSLLTPPPTSSASSSSQQRILTSSALRGDTTIRPNTGNTNQEIGSMFGSLREITTALRWMTITTTITAIFWEGFAFPIRILSTAFTQPAKIVLGGYLGIFCLLLLGVELNAPLRNSFGFLYNPMTRGLILLLMCTMCFGILKSWWESLLGISFIICGIGYIYAYIKYPEYRRWQDYNATRPTTWQEVRQYWMNTNGNRNSSSSRYGIPTSVWANPDDGQERTAWDIIHQSTTTTSSEARALLHNL